MFYTGKHRKNLADDSDIKALEEARLAELNPKPAEEPVEVDTSVAPDPETLPEPKTVEEDTFKKRYSDLRRHMAAKEKEWNTRFAELEAKLAETAKQAVALPESPDDVTAWMKEYPDVAKVVTEIARRQAAEKFAEVEKFKEQVEKDRRANARQAAELKLREAHPDIDQLRNDVDFHDWVGKQPKLIQDALYHNETDWRAAARAIDLFKADKAALAPKRGRPRKEEADASAAVVTKNRAEPTEAPAKRMWKESEIQKMHWRDYEANEADILAARAEGRLIYDLSKKMASM